MTLGENVQLYPLAGYTAGQCGLIVTEPALTTLITGDAVPTRGHFLAGQVFADCWDVEKAKESLQEIMEVADVIVPGHDNMFWRRVGGGCEEGWGVASDAGRMSRAPQEESGV